MAQNDDKTAQELALYRAVFDEIPDVIILKDENGDFLLCNQTVARLYNTTPEAMVGKHDGDFGVPQEMADAFRENVQGIMARGRTEIVFEDSRDAVSGEIRHFKSIKKPFKDADGRSQILVIANDITDVVRAQQRVAESEQRLSEVMDATQEGIWDWHIESGRVIHNPQWYSILGYDDGEIADSVEAFATCIYPDDVAAVWQRIQDLVNGKTPVYYSEHRMVCKDGRILWVQDRGRIAERDATGRPVRVVGAYADITERRRAKDALEAALHQAQSATRAKSEFLATMSHEIRTPLNGILGMAELLAGDNIDEAARKEFAGVIAECGKTLLTVLNDILDFSKVEAGRLEIVRGPFDPRRLVHETAALFEPRAQSKGLTLKVSNHGLSGRQYVGDIVRLRQMLSNYLGNAVKFTHDGEITVDVAEIDVASGLSVLEFSVTDTGIGIEPDKHGVLFNPFTQADSSTTREYGGTGLGLSIVSRLAELMNGSVGLDSDAGKGSRFWFRIPAEVLADSAGETTSAPADPADDVVAALPGRLLVAEDNELNRRVLHALLAKLGLSADFVYDGAAAVAATLEGTPPALILMDIQMPGMDGIEATRQIRAREAEAGRPPCTIIALTAGAFEEDRQRCIHAGMQDFLAKPVNLETLRHALAHWLQRPLTPA